MEIYTPKTKIKLSPVIRNGREFVEVTFGNDNDIRLSLSKEENVLLVGGRAYLPAEDFVLAEFFDRYVKMAFIDYSAIKETAPRKEEDKRPPLPEGYLEKLQQVRYSDHTVRVYTSYFRDFQQHFEGRKIETVTPGEINDYLLYLIHEKNISSCQQNQRINAIKFYYEKVLGQERRCYKVNRAKRGFQAFSHMHRYHHYLPAVRGILLPRSLHTGDAAGSVSDSSRIHYPCLPVLLLH